jgi:hypothetical protein
VVRALKEALYGRVMLASSGMVLAAQSGWVLAGPLIAVGGALAVQALIRLMEVRDKRRDEYSRAFAAAMVWTEFPYRIARRFNDDADACEPIVALMHEAQESIAFHQNWLRSVSESVASAYENLVTAVKDKAAPHIEAAWRRAPAHGPDGMILGDAYPVDVSKEIAEFTRQVQRDLSWHRRVWSG